MALRNRLKGKMASILATSLSLTWLMATLTPKTEAQVYAYEEDFDRSYPGAGPYGYYHNICNFECPDAWSPVCATDGYTYPSGCHLFVASCWKQILGQKGTSFWYKGTCLLEGSTNYDPQPGLQKREEEERQKKIDAGEWVPTTPPTDAIYINGQPYLPPYNPAPSEAPTEPEVREEEEAGEVEEDEEEEDEEDEGGEGGDGDADLARDEDPIESRRRRRRRSLLDSLKPRRQHRRRRHRRHRLEDECHWTCPLTPEPLCGSDGKTHFNKCHFLRLKCRVDAARRAAAAAEQEEEEEEAASAEEMAVDDAEPRQSGVRNATEVVAFGDPSKGRKKMKAEEKELEIRHGGKCGRFADASDVRVRDCVSQCGGRAEDHEVRPVCASDGKTYPNFCFYQQAKCLAYLNRKPDVTFFKMGFCDR